MANKVLFPLEVSVVFLWNKAKDNFDAGALEGLLYSLRGEWKASLCRYAYAAAPSARYSRMAMYRPLGLNIVQHDGLGVLYFDGLGILRDEAR